VKTDCPTCGFELETANGLQCPRCGDALSCSDFGCSECQGCTGSFRRAGKTLASRLVSRKDGTDDGSGDD